MSKTTAYVVEMAIILLCIASLVMIFQPFSLQLFTIGCITVVIGGLAFNLIPFCREGVPVSQLFRVVIIVLVVLAVAIILGILAANAYVWYLGTLR
jgi:hypothetical protein